MECLTAEKLIDAVGEAFRGREVDNFLRGRLQYELTFGIGKRVMSDERGDVAELRRFRFQEFAARGHAIEKIRNADGRARWQAGRLYAGKFSAGKFNACSFSFFFRARFEQQTRNGRDRRQGFAAEAERGNGEQVVGGA